MIWGFDIDGVLCDIDVPQLQIIDSLPDDKRGWVEKLYYADRKTVLNPELLLAEGDIWYAITARRADLEPITKKWLDKFCPTYKELFCVGEGGWDSPPYNGSYKEWIKMASNNKIELFEELGLEIYIDDSPSNVEKYRRMTDIPIIKYGTRIGLR
jgi:hypothetical protein